MKNIFIALIAFMALNVQAETTYDITCSMDAAQCTVPVNGMMTDIESVDMPKFIPMGDPTKYDCEDGPFCRNSGFDIVGLNPNWEGYKQQVDPNVGLVAPPTTSAINPFNATFLQDDKINANGHVVLTKYNVEMVVLADAVEVKGLLLNNNPKCIDLAPNTYMKKLSMGDRIKFRTGCRPVQIDVTTDSGSWALRFE